MRTTGVLAFLLALLLSGCSSGGRAAPPTSSAPPSVTARPVAAHSVPLSFDRVVRASPRVAYVVASSSSTPDVDVALLRVVDAGRHVQRVVLPTARGRAGRRLRITQLVFVGARDGYAVLGSAYDGRGTALESTTDGGRSWTAAHLPGLRGLRVAAVAGHGSRVFAVTVGCARSGSCRRTRLYSSPVGGSWRRVPGSLPVRDEADGVALAAWDSSVWLQLGVGGPHGVSLRSVDEGRSFSSAPGPEASGACDLVATSSRVAWSSCGTGMLVRSSREAGAAPWRDLSLGDRSGTGGAFLTPVSDRVAFAGYGLGRSRGLRLTRDGGRTFTRVAGYPPGPAYLLGSDSVAFESARVGLAAAGNRGLFRTHDVGRTWQRVRVG